MCPLLSLDSHNVIYCCKFSCSDWFFCTFPIKHFLVSDLPWCMVSVLELTLIFRGVFLARHLEQLAAVVLGRRLSVDAPASA